MIPFNKPYITGKEVHYIYDAVASGHISGNGKYDIDAFTDDNSRFKSKLISGNASAF